VGAAAGAVIGGLAGKGVAEMIDPTAEEAYWRKLREPSWHRQGATFDDYGPAYRYGGASNTVLERLEDAEPELMRDWDRAKGTSRLTWDNAKHATRDSWQRVSDSIERAIPGDSAHDGK
jgi:hypothetical protein